ncbi:MAG TPA: SLC13 family permease [Caulobacteraceae bacterium]
MTLHQGLAFGLVILTVAGFASGRVRYDLVALLSLFAGLIVGVIPAPSAFDGFKSDVVVIIACALIVSAAIARSGVVEAVTAPLFSRLNTEQTQAPVLTVTTALLSMATKNVGALAVMMPSAQRLAARTGTSLGRLLMPMAFASLVGGLVTLVGTSSNIIASQVREQATGHPFQMFDFAPVGLSITAISLIYLCFAYRLLPAGAPGAATFEEGSQDGAYATEIHIPDDWQGERRRTVGALEKLAHGEVEVVALIRGKRRRTSPGASSELRPGDTLILEGDQAHLDALIAQAGFELSPAARPLDDVEGTEEVRVVEAVVAPGSPLAGKSAGRVGLHHQFGVNLLAVGRSSGRVTQQLKALTLQVGDMLVLQAGERALPAALRELGALPLAPRPVRLGSANRGAAAVAILVAAMAIVALKIAPVAITFFGAAVAMLAVGALTMRQAYDSLDGQVLVIIAALVPVSEAVQHTGGTAVIAAALSAGLGGLPPMLSLGLMMLAAMLAAPFLHNAPTVLILGPVAVSLAHALKLSPDSFLMAVATGAGCDFLTPVGHQCNTLVMKPGGYRFGDYARLGAPLSLLVLLLGTPLIAFFWGR